MFVLALLSQVKAENKTKQKNLKKFWTKLFLFVLV